MARTKEGGKGVKEFRMSLELEKEENRLKTGLKIEILFHKSHEKLQGVIRDL